MTTTNRARRMDATGYPTRDARRRARLRRRLQMATTAEEQLAAAYDWLRSEVAHMRDTGARAGRQRDVAEYLIRVATEIGKEGN